MSANPPLRMNRPKHLLSCLLLLISCLGFSQKKSAWVSGKVIDENENPLQNVSVVILGRQTGIATNDTGYFRLKVPADKAFAIIFSYTGYGSEQKNFLLSENEEEHITIRLERGLLFYKESSSLISVTEPKPA